MSVMFEVYYKGPQDHERESTLTKQVAAFNGRLDFWEENEIAGVCNYVCLTYEFSDWEKANNAAQVLQSQGEHVEGPYEYGE